MQFLGSYARSGEEATWRREGLTLGLHLRQARATLIEAMQTFKEIGG